MDTHALRKQTRGLLIMLALQFVLGMLLNLYVKLPDTRPGTSGSDYFARITRAFGWGISASGGVVLMLHILVATGLLASSLILLIQAGRSKIRAWIAVAAAGAIGILGALFNGLSFLSYNHDYSSFIMAMGYVIATTAYAWGATLTYATTPHATAHK